MNIGEFIPETDWEQLPVGDYLVKLNSEESPNQVATIFLHGQKQKVVLVGYAFAFDCDTLAGYYPKNLQGLDNG